MTFDKATAQDTGMLTELRIAYLQEDLGEINEYDVGGRKGRKREHY